ncbi:sodium:proton antiporter [Bacillus coahuilensis m2-6]|uniref:Na+/H+ antiporter family protein n=1 Tax=Bacillus coahuilensis TaxID=408580 RepID=UPI0007501358|nr:Na+/H+ antiporter NhaC family protein [Bacillus coahuilensis]KUP06100.1 sodium:proton antiporter [Bacillus coahuilensis m2-6]
MNAVIIAVLVMLVLSLLRINVVIALVVGALAGGLSGGLGLEGTLKALTEGLGGGATIALSYALLGGFAVAISSTGFPNLLVNIMVKLVGKEGESKRKVLSKVALLLVILIISIMSQNVVPIHIAFIPILIPPLLKVMNELGLDRRLIATVITFGLTAPYILLPYGFGLMFHEIIAENMATAGMDIRLSDVPKAMVIPVGGMVIGLLTAIFISYRKQRTYIQVDLTSDEGIEDVPSKWNIIASSIAIIVSLFIQIETDSMILAALTGLLILYMTKAVEFSRSDELLTDGMKMMAFIGFVMITANGFSNVVKETGDVAVLVDQTSSFIGSSQTLGALLMLIVGLFITMGIGSSFATIPIIATIFVPLASALGFSPLATIAIIGTAGALGDAGAPASDSTLGPTAGLNADGQHHHIWDTCVPTFIHFNIPLVVFGWIAALVL